MYSLALIIFVVSEKKAFEHFPIGNPRWPPPQYIDPNGGGPPWENVPMPATKKHTTLIKAKLFMNDHWMALGNL